MKQTTFADTLVPDRCEVRQYRHVERDAIVRQKQIQIACPFCGAKVLAYVWSLCGSGKRCTGDDCGAIFGGFGDAYKRKA